METRKTTKNTVVTNCDRTLCGAVILLQKYTK